MKPSSFIVIIATFLVCRVHLVDAADDKPVKRPKFTVSKETTFITKPLTDDGFPDYVAAINERLGQGVTPENNAVVMYYRAWGNSEFDRPNPELFKLLGMPIPADDGQYLVGFTETLKLNFIERDDRYRDMLNQKDQSLDGPWTEKELPEVAQWLKLNEKPLSFVTAGSKRGQYYSPMFPYAAKREVDARSAALINMNMYELGRQREVARMLTSRAMLHLGNGNVDAAWQDLQTCHRIARLVKQGPTAFSVLVGIVIDAKANRADLIFLDTVQPCAQQAREYLKQIERLPSLLNVAKQFDFTERFIFLDSTLMIARVGKQEMESFADDLWPKAWSGEINMGEIEWDVVLRNGNEWFDRFGSALRTNDRAKMQQKLAQLEEEGKKLASRAKDKKRLTQVFVESKSKGAEVAELMSDILIAGMMTPLCEVPKAVDRAVQRDRNLRIAFALAAFHADHGQYPKTLGLLKPDCLKQIPNDIFSHKELNYRRADDGYLLYSIGLNGKDEAGRSRRYDDPQGDDIRVHMPLAK